ncbi:hypothetical protein [Geodermatophilus amargosae]|uniref:hypothetical protein n=1 Tax=Geodermatophilus amargosae TaxID=1296565 RepID=UPI0034E054B1
MRIRYTAALITTAAATFTLTACGGSGADTPEAAITGYLDAALAGDFEAACGYLDETFAQVYANVDESSSCQDALAHSWDAEQVRDNRDYQVVTDRLIAESDHLVRFDGTPVLIARDGDDPELYNDGIEDYLIKQGTAVRETPDGWKITIEDQLG